MFGFWVHYRIGCMRIAPRLSEYMVGVAGEIPSSVRRDWIQIFSVSFAILLYSTLVLLRDTTFWFWETQETKFLPRYTVIGGGSFVIKIRRPICIAEANDRQVWTQLKETIMKSANNVVNAWIGKLYLQRRKVLDAWLWETEDLQQLNNRA